MGNPIMKPYLFLFLASLLFVGCASPPEYERSLSKDDRGNILETRREISSENSMGNSVAPIGQLFNEGPPKRGPKFP